MPKSTRPALRQTNRRSGNTAASFRTVKGLRRRRSLATMRVLAT